MRQAGSEKQAGSRRSWRRWLFTLLWVYVLLCAVMALLQRKLMYFPDGSPVPLPARAAREGLRDVELQAGDGTRLWAWYWPGARPVTLLIFHGNAGNRRHRLEWMEDLRGLGLGVFILDYRGYGGSEGSPSEEGLYADGEAAVAWLAKEGAPGLVYLGESLGSGVALELALRKPPRAVILQSGFSSAVDVARHHYPFLPVGLLMSDCYLNDRKIGRAGCPVLMFHGESDRIVPVALGRRLFAAAREPREFYLVPGAGHNDLPWTGGGEYLRRLDAFVRRHVEG